MELVQWEYFALLAIAMELVFIEFFRVVVLKGRQFISTFI